MISILMLK